MLIILLLTLIIYVIRPGDWSVGADIRWNLILNVIGAIAVFFAVANGQAKRTADRSWAFMWGFFGWMLLSNIVQFQFSTIESYFTDMLTNLVVFMLVALAIQNQAQARLVVLVFCLCILFVGFQCYLQWNQGVNWPGTAPIQRWIASPDGTPVLGPQVRWIGVFNDPNDTGMLLITMAPLAFARALFLPGAGGSKLLWGGVFAALVYCIYLTNSRGTFVALLAAIGMFFIIKQRSVPGLILAATAGFILLTLGPSRMGDVGAGDSSAMERVYSWILALELTAMHPVFGLGPNHWVDHHHMATHNSYVQAVVENGPIGYTLYLSVFMIALFAAVRIALNDPTKATQVTAAALTSCLIGVLVSAFFISRTYVLLPFFMSSLVLAYCRVLSPMVYQEAMASLNIFWLGGIAGASIIFIWLTNRLSTMFML